MEYEHLSCARSRSGRRVRSLWNVALSHTWLSFADPLFGLVPFCSAVLACAVQRRESAVIIHTAPLCGAPSPPRIRPLGVIRGPGPVPRGSSSPALHFTHDRVYMSVLLSPLIRLSLPSCVHVSILYICVSRPADRIISTTFLDSTYVG